MNSDRFLEQTYKTPTLVLVSLHILLNKFLYKNNNNYQWNPLSFFIIIIGAVTYTRNYFSMCPLIISE